MYSITRYLAIVSLMMVTIFFSSLALAEDDFVGDYTVVAAASTYGGEQVFSVNKRAPPEDGLYEISFTQSAFDGTDESTGTCDDATVDGNVLSCNLKDVDDPEDLIRTIEIAELSIGVFCGELRDPATEPKVEGIESVFAWADVNCTETTNCVCFNIEKLFPFGMTGQDPGAGIGVSG